MPGATRAIGFFLKVVDASRQLEIRTSDGFGVKSTANAADPVFYAEEALVNFVEPIAEGGDHIAEHYDDLIEPLVTIGHAISVPHERCLQAGGRLSVRCKRLE
jgi:hypothetical protein